MIEPRNRVVQVRSFGDPETLEVVDAPLPSAGLGEVRVRVLASSLNYTEVLIRRHLYPQTMRLRPPFVMGYDVVGEIDQLGEGVRNLQIGNRVADMTVVGSNADYRTLRANDVARVPEGLDAAEAATLILSWTTAYQLLHRAARVRRGQRVLVWRCRRRRAGAARAREAGRPRAVGHRSRRTHSARPRARRNADRLPARGLHARAAGRVRHHRRRRWRRRLSPLIRGAQARRSALRHWLLRERAGTASHASYRDGDCAPVPVEAVAWWQACPLLLSQCDASATSHLVQGGLAAIIRASGNGCHPAARCRADLLRPGRRGSPSPRSRRS
ncbi:hypothetical protein ACVII1_003672 [Bradyrhizobium elkanii]